ncbi:hypothetical protein AMATHDRAFT_147287 [Amanita thiersii Skay4041]|uniref:Band 7 domain-containing protein n=1 Tax=Amanita thiersii Skay4041 TaxID=703135 RepID=A0A2A9NPG6_9AGAR|nr:hypothetical protein AMATHDRAFT_147287 [Amanita thiersii Skay4041]
MGSVALQRYKPLGRRNIVTIIEQGHEAWRLTFGQDPVRLLPGLCLNIPVLHTIKHVDMRESSISIPQLPGYTADNVPVSCTGSLFYRITDSYKACFEVSEVEENIKNTGMSAVRSILGHFTYDQVICDRNEFNNRLKTVIGSSIVNWGVECSRFEIQSFQPANREVERQLELQMEAERHRRKQLLDTQAQINVAEGQKQRVILESEGHLAAKGNEADALYKLVVREAEAKKLQALLEASAVAQQVEELARSIAEDKEHIQQDDRKLALSTLVELKRLEQLKAIASSQSNSTYFFGDRSALGAGAQTDYAVDLIEQLKNGSGRVRDFEAKKSDQSLH